MTFRLTQIDELIRGSITTSKLVIYAISSKNIPPDNAQPTAKPTS